MAPTQASSIEERLRKLHSEERILWTRPLVGGISAKMTSYELEGPNGRRRLIARELHRDKFKHSETPVLDEYKVVSALHTAGLPVQKPVAVTPEFYVVEFIEGAVEVAPTNVPAFIERYARQLAAIHKVDWEGLGFLRRQQRGFGSRPETPNDSLRETEVRNALEAYHPRGSNPPVLRHGDFWPGNVLWRDGGIVGVIDWEEALVGEPLADAGICRLDLWWILGEEAAKEFTELYLVLNPIDARDLPFWDLCASLRPMPNIEEWCGAYPDLGRPDITEATMRRDHQAFVEQALRRLAA